MEMGKATKKIKSIGLDTKTVFSKDWRLIQPKSPLGGALII